MMALDRHRTRCRSTMLAARPSGFVRRYYGVPTTPKARPASIRRCATPSSASAHITFCTLMEFVRPQTVTMLPRSELERGSRAAVASRGARADPGGERRAREAGREDEPSVDHLGAERRLRMQQPARARAGREAGRLGHGDPGALPAAEAVRGRRTIDSVRPAEPYDAFEPRT